LILIGGFQIEGFPIDEEFVAGFRSRRDPIDSHEIQALQDFLQFSRDLICSIVSRSPAQIRSISENKKKESSRRQRLDYRSDRCRFKKKAVIVSLR
jgi:hypothetical protein